MTTDSPAATHPRPQLTRARWRDLCGDWRFAHDDADAGLTEGWQHRTEPFTRTIRVPYPPESTASGIGAREPHEVVWYRRTFTVTDAERAAGRLLLHFGAVDYEATVWVNGVEVVRHAGGHTPFSADVTEALAGGDAEQSVVVRSADPLDDLDQPRGKQDWQHEPHAVWYDRTTGIWQPVWLEPVPALRVDALRWGSDIARGAVSLGLRLSARPARPVHARVRLRLGGELLAEQTVRMDHADTELDLPVAGGRNGIDRTRLQWSPETPTLIDAEVALLDEDGRPLDEVGSYLGFRGVSTDTGRFLLNGRPYFLRLVLEQGFWPDTHLAAPDDAALRREAELIKELGFNGARIHQKAEDPRFLYWCDRLGLLVWDEMPAAYRWSARAAAALSREWTEVVERDVSHPCVVAWVPLNESWGVPDIAADPRQQAYAAALYHLTKALDGSRPVISNDGWEHVRSDLWTIHDYTPSGASVTARYGDAESLREALTGPPPATGQRRLTVAPLADDEFGRPAVLSEYGGWSFAPRAGEKWFGYATIANEEEFLARYTELTGAAIDSPVLAGFCYTQLTDTGQETNGLLTARREPKLDVAAVRAVNTRAAASMPREELTAYRAAVAQAAPRADAQDAPVTPASPGTPSRPDAGQG